MKKCKRTPRADTAEHSAPANASVVSQKCGGTEDMAALERFRQEVFEANIERWKTGRHTKDDLVAAFGFWVGYPMFLEVIGYDWQDNSIRREAYYALNHAHIQATQLLMKEAEKHGLDPFALNECARVVQEIYGHQPGKYYTGRYNTWPGCMGQARYKLPPSQQQALREGEAVFIRLAVKLSIADEASTRAVARTVAQTLPKLPIPNDTISIAVVLRDYVVSRHTVYRYIKDKKIRDCRPPNAPQNAPYVLSRAEIDKYFGRK